MKTDQTDDTPLNATIRPGKAVSWIRCFAALLLGIGILLGLHTGGKLLKREWLSLWLWLLPVASLLYLSRASLPRAKPTGISRSTLPGVVLLLLACLTLFSSLTNDFEFYFVNWMTSTDPIPQLFSTPAAWFVLLTAFLGVVFIRRVPSQKWLWFIVLVVVQGTCIHHMLDVTNGHPIYRDDHPSFMFRIWEFTQTFPQFVNYNPYWNGGVVAHMGMSSGIGAITLLFWPIWNMAEPQQVYTGVIMLMYIVCIPWMIVASMYIMRAPRHAAFIAGILSLGVCTYFFKWVLHFGTIGANFSIPFIVPVAACLYRAIYLGKRDIWLGPVLVLSVLILFAWPPCAIVMAALIPSLLIASRRFSWKLTLFFAICAVAFFAVYWKHLYLILSSSETFQKHVVNVVASTEAKEHFSFNMDSIKGGVDHLLRRLRDGHPVLIFLGFAGAAFYPSRRFRLWFLPLILMLAIIAGWGRYYFPGLQLRRMYMPLMFASIVPAAMWCSRLLSTRGLQLSFLRGALAALLLLGGWNVTQIYANKGNSPYRVLSPEMEDLISWIRLNTPEDGRILFAGRTVHKFGRAHVAALPLFTKREMMACDYYAFSPKVVEYEYPPRVFRTAEDGTHDFMQLYNVSHVICYQGNYVRHFTERPHQYELVKQIEDKNIHVFRVNNPSGPFLKGSGKTHATFNELRIDIDDPTEEIVVRHNWHEHLVALPPAELYPYKAHDDVTFIGIRANGSKQVEIRFESSL